MNANIEALLPPTLSLLRLHSVSVPFPSYGFLHICACLRVGLLGRNGGRRCLFGGLRLWHPCHWFSFNLSQPPASACELCCTMLLIHSSFEMPATASLRQSFSTWKKYGFLYDGYDLQRGLWWWEFVVMSRKLAFMTVISTVDEPFAQVICAPLLL